jgi:hypothetical protein
MADAQALAIGRTARGFVASAALVIVALWALLGLAWSCCGTPSFAETIGGFVGFVPLAVVATVALPPVTRRVQTSGLRWWLAPLVVADIGVCGWLSWPNSQLEDELPREVVYMFAPLVVPNLICAIYVAWRVVLHPPTVGPLDKDEETTPTARA